MKKNIFLFCFIFLFALITIVGAGRFDYYVPYTYDVYDGSINSSLWYTNAGSWSSGSGSVSETTSYIQAQTSGNGNYIGSGYANINSTNLPAISEIYGLNLTLDLLAQTVVISGSSSATTTVRIFGTQIISLSSSGTNSYSNSSNWNFIRNASNSAYFDYYVDNTFVSSFIPTNNVIEIITSGSVGGGGHGSGDSVLARIRAYPIIYYNDENVLLTSPEDGYASIIENVTFNATLMPGVNFENSNATLFLWYNNGSIANQSTNTLSGSSGVTTSWTLEFPESGAYKWNVYGCFDNSTSTVCEFAESNNSIIYGFQENSVTYNAVTYETAHESFVLDFTTINLISASATLYYNGTAYPSTMSCSGDQCTATNEIDLPLISSSAQNNSFYWAVEIYDGTSRYTQNSQTYLQELRQLSLTYCSSGNIALNFTAHDEQNKSRIFPFNFQGNFNYYLGNGQTYRTLSVSNLSTNEVYLCVNSNSTYYLDSIIAYSAPNATVTYPTRNYFFQKSPISNNSQDIPLYLLKSDSSTSFILQVQDQNNLPVTNVLVNVQRCYAGTNTNETVFISRTDSNGLTVGNFEAETALYQFFITNQSQTLLAVTPCAKVVPQTVPYTLLFQLGGYYNSPFVNIQNITAMYSNLYFNYTNNILTWTYIDTSGLFVNASIIVRALNYSGSYQPIVCSSFSTLPTGVINCNVSESGTYVADVYVYRTTEKLIDQIVFTVSEFAPVVGYYGVFLAFFIILIAAFAFKWNEIAGIWMVNVAVIFVNIIGLVSFGKVFITAMICVSVIITAILER